MIDRTRSGFFGTPCINSKFEEVKAGRLFYGRSERLYWYQSCAMKGDKLEEIIKHFPSAVKRIHKRALTDAIFKNARLIGQIAKAMATLWIRGGCKMVVFDTAEHIARSSLDKVLDSSHQDYSNQATTLNLEELKLQLEINRSMDALFESHESQETFEDF